MLKVNYGKLKHIRTKRHIDAKAGLGRLLIFLFVSCSSDEIKSEQIPHALLLLPNIARVDLNLPLPCELGVLLVLPFVKGLFHAIQLLGLVRVDVEELLGGATVHLIDRRLMLCAGAKGRARFRRSISMNKCILLSESILSYSRIDTLLQQTKQ